MKQEKKEREGRRIRADKHDDRVQHLNCPISFFAAF